ncbi:hypothetical protein MHBO_001083 [Bonamia ostreae]|uniref:Uncharacterized protein n=1 Tax=Bonamia ostreae TaxID=126728 RepID=A0ABV2AIM1_9EUKA
MSIIFLIILKKFQCDCVFENKDIYSIPDQICGDEFSLNSDFIKENRICYIGCKNEKFRIKKNFLVPSIPYAHCVNGQLKYRGKTFTGQNPLCVRSEEELCYVDIIKKINFDWNCSKTAIKRNTICRFRCKKGLRINDEIPLIKCGEGGKFFQLNTAKLVANLDKFIGKYLMCFDDSHCDTFSLNTTTKITGCIKNGIKILNQSRYIPSESVCDAECGEIKKVKCLFGKWINFETNKSLNKCRKRFCPNNLYSDAMHTGNCHNLSTIPIGGRCSISCINGFSDDFGINNREKSVLCDSFGEFVNEDGSLFDPSNIEIFCHSNKTCSHTQIKNMKNIFECSKAQYFTSGTFCKWDCKFSEVKLIFCYDGIWFEKDSNDGIKKFFFECIPRFYVNFRVLSYEKTRKNRSRNKLHSTESGLLGHL